jgi:hypothetical protein
MLLQSFGKELGRSSSAVLLDCSKIRDLLAVIVHNPASFAPCRIAVHAIVIARSIVPNGAPSAVYIPAPFTRCNL